MSTQRRNASVKFGPQPAEPEEVIYVQGAGEPKPAPTVIDMPEPPPARPQTAVTATEQPSAEAAFDAYHALIRLLVGGAVEGSAELTYRLEEWEARVRAAGDPPALSREEEKPADLARYALIGLAFEGAEFARKQVPVWTARVTRTAEFSGKVARPFVRNPITGFVGKWWDGFIAGGEQSIQRWIETGRGEEPMSRAVARTAVSDVIDDLLNYLAQNEEVADLIQSQSVGLAGEVVEEVRSRTVSADLLAEGLIRKLLRRPQRTDFPAPPDEVRTLVEPKKTTTRRG